MRDLARWTCAVGLTLFCQPAAAQTLYRLTDLTPWTDRGEAWAINANGQVTGRIDAASWVSPAFRGDSVSSQRLPQLGTGFSLGWAINASGQITGYSTIGDTVELRAVLWDGDEIREIGSLGGREASGTAINDAGHVAGFSTFQPGLSDRRAFYWDGSTMLDLGALGGDTSHAEDINAAGHVVGGAAVNEYFSHAFLWDGVLMHDLGSLGEFSSSSAVAVNERAQVAGSSTFPDDGREHAVFWDADGTIVDLGTLGGRESETVALNELGEVAGNSFTGSFARGFFWNGAPMRDIGTLGGDTSEVRGMNGLGQIVGVSQNATGARRPFFWDGTAMHDLDALVDPRDPLRPYVTLDEAWRINDRGDIAAEGKDSRQPGNVHVFLLSRVTAAQVTLAGFGRPVDAVPTMNLVQPGKSVPLRFRVATAQGAPVDDLAEVDLAIRVERCGVLDATGRDRVERYAKQRSGLENLGRGNYRYNWKTAKSAKGCRVVSLSLPSAYASTPVSLSAYFRFTN